MTQKSDKKIKGWALAGAIVGLMGGIIGAFGGGYSLYEKLFPPSIEVLGVRPVYVRGSKIRTVDWKKQEFPRRGISFIVHMKSGSRAVSVNRLELSGKLYLTYDEWTMYNDMDGKPIFDQPMVDEFKTKKPYYTLSLTGWLNDSRSIVNFEPYQEGHLRFTFLDPISYTRGRSNHPEYVGFVNPYKEPTLTRFYLEAYEFFRRDLKSGIDIPKEIRQGTMKLYLIAGTQRVEVSPKEILSLKTIFERDWNKESILALYHQEPIVYRQSEPW